MLSVIAAIFFLIWSIANFADANGWVMLAYGATNGKGGLSFFSFFYALFSTLIVFLSCLNMYHFCKRDTSDE